MRVTLLIFAMLLTAGLAQDEGPRYSCPEMDIDFEHNNLEEIEDVASWQDCGEQSALCTTTTSYIVCTCATFRRDM